MAASLTPAQKKENFKEAFLTCAICSEPYDNNKHKAKCLPCLHTYCKSCLEKIAGKRPKIDCPTCRKEVTFPGETVESLPHNFLVENLRDYQDIFHSSIVCGSCKRQNAVCFCNDCSAFFCQTCLDAHSQLGILSNHQISTMAELQETQRNPMRQQQQHCTKHPKQDVTMYCRETDCKLPVCATCGLLDHRGHDLIELSDAISQIIDDLHQNAADISERNQELSHMQSAQEGHQETLTTNFKKTEKAMQELAAQLKNGIDTSFSKAHMHLNKLYETEMANMSASLDSIIFLSAQMTSACEFANESCDRNLPLQLLTTQDQIMKRLNELKIAKLPDIASNNTKFNFAANQQSAMVQFTESLQDLCNVKWILPFDPEQSTINFDLACERKGYWKKASIQTMDTDGQKITNGGAKIKVTQDGNVPYEVQDHNDGTYSFNYDQLEELRVRVKINGTEMKGSPFQQRAVKQQVDPKQCTIQFNLPCKRKGYWKKASIQTVDIYGQKMTTGGAKIEVKQDGKPPYEVEDNNDGTYSFLYDQLEELRVRVKINGTEMKGSPFQQRAVKQQVDPKQCTIQFGLPEEVYRYPNCYKAIVQTVDCNGIKMRTGGAKVKVHGGDTGYLTDNNDGTYSFTYDTTYGPVYVSINGTALKGSPFSV